MSNANDIERNLSRSSTFSLTIEWLVFVLAMSLTSFALGMLFAMLNFDLRALLSVIRGVHLVPVGVAIALVVFWLRQLIRRTRQAELPNN